MNIWINIPSGNRKDQLVETVKAWNKLDFDICLLTWDTDVYDHFLSKSIVTVLMKNDTMRSFGANQNNMAYHITEMGVNWDAIICGADDLHPPKNLDLLHKKVEDNQGKVLWVKDGLFNSQPTHPVITRAWYDKYKNIFDETYRHNFVDTDLAMRLCERNELVKCFDVGFKHQHYLGGSRTKDSLDKYGQRNFDHDHKWFWVKHPMVNVEETLRKVAVA